MIGVSLEGASKGVKEGLISLALALRESLELLICIVVLDVGSSVVEVCALSMADDDVRTALLVWRREAREVSCDELSEGADDVEL